MFSSQSDDYSDQFYAQETSICQAPREKNGMFGGGGMSPKKKKRPHNAMTFKMFGKGGNGGQDNNENYAPSIFQMSQDMSQGFSQNQFSQSSQSSFIGNYFGQMTVHDGGIDEPSFSNDGFQISGTHGSSSTHSNSAGTNSNGSFQLPRNFGVDRFDLMNKGTNVNNKVNGGDSLAQPSKPLGSSSSGNGADTKAIEKERQITLPAATQNPFLPKLTNAITAKPQHMWISAFKQWSRYSWDFEVQCLLGEGVQSLVYCAKKRVDGCLYAVKRLKRQIMTEKEGLLLTREACALAAFAGCPHLLRYYSSWIDDGYLYIQTELCALGSLDNLVGAKFVSDSDKASGNPNHGAPLVDLRSQSPKTQPNGVGLFGSLVDSQFMSEDLENDQVASLSQLPLSQIDPNPMSQILMSQMELNDNDGDDETGVVQGAPEELIWLILAKISQSLAFLHARSVAHLDVRPANIFVSAGGHSALPSNELADHCKAALDSLLQTTPYHEHPSPTLVAKSLISDQAVLRLGDLGQCCSIYSSDFIEGESRYCPREVINGDLKNVDLCKADVFSLGATCYELCLGRQLGAGGEGALEWHSLRDGVLCDYVAQRYSTQLVETLRFMMHPSPAQRPSAQAVVEVAGANSRFHQNDEVERLRAEVAELRALIVSTR